MGNVVGMCVLEMSQACQNIPVCDKTQKRVK